MKRWISLTVGLSAIALTAGAEILLNKLSLDDTYHFLRFLTWSSLLICFLGFCAALGFLSFGPAGLFILARSLRVLVMAPRPADLRGENRVILQGMIRYAYAGGALAVVAGAIYVFSILPGLQFGPGLALMLLGALYAVLLAEFVLRPALTTLKLAAETQPGPGGSAN